MKKIKRFIFSGFFTFAIILLVEIALITFLRIYLDNRVSAWISESGKSIEEYKIVIALIYVLIRLVIAVICIFIFFRMVNKKEDPEFKIPWLVLMLILPLFAMLMYLVFANHGLRKKDRIIIQGSRNAYDAHFHIDNKEDIKKTERAYGAFKYINSVTRLGAHEKNRVTYYKNGESFFPALLEGLKQAKEFIFIEFFIISEGKEWSAVQEILKEKAAQGVEVQIIYDDMGCTGTISSRTPKKLAEYGIKCYKFHKFNFFLSGAYNNRDHRKIVIIDHQMAFTGGINLADEYANEIERFGYWKDTMVKIEGSAIGNLIATFLQNLDLASNSISNYNKYLIYDYPTYRDSGVVMPFGDGPGGIDGALIGEQTYINILNYAQKEVFISTPYLIPTYSLWDAMRNASLRGVKVHLIIPGIPDKKIVYAVSKSHLNYLLEAGVNVYIYKPGFNHMKTALADEELAFVGTINLDFRSLVHHFECGTLLYNNSCLKDVKKDFEEMISQSEKVPVTFKQKTITRAFLGLIKLFYPLL